MKRLTIEDMQRVAEKREGRCLSDQYVNNKTKLRWKCKDQHVWDAIPTNVISGSWCPYCTRIRKTRVN